jgi:hypothetical protein
VVEHPVRDDHVELPVRERERLDVGDLRLHPALRRQRDHARREVDRLHVGAELAPEPLGELAGPAPGIQQPLGRALRDRGERDVLGVVALDELPVRRVALGLALLARVLPLDDQRAVQLQPSTIAWPGMPRDGAFPPSHALTVAPTSANSPPWIRPAAFLPST